MRLLTLTLFLFFAVSACSTTELRPDTSIPASLTDSVAIPVMTGTTKGDLWKLIARMKSSIQIGNSKLASIRCIELAKQSISNKEAVEECSA